MRSRLLLLGETICIFVLLFVARLLLFVPFRVVAPRLTCAIEGKNARVRHEAGYIRHLYRKMHRLEPYIPWKCTCLTKAITAKWILRMVRIPNTLVLGVLREEITNDLKAHAWIIAGDQIVTGGAGHEAFRPIAQFTDVRA